MSCDRLYCKKKKKKKHKTVQHTLKTADSNLKYMWIVVMGEHLKKNSFKTVLLKSASNMGIPVVHLQICLPPTSTPPKTTPYIEGSGGQAALNWVELHWVAS